MTDVSSVPQPKSVGSFASMLASLTGSAERSTATWDDTALADDVATISYDQALRTHRRVPAAETLTVFESPSHPGDLVAATPTPGGKRRKTASITIRLTPEEESQLHQRAAAAQLSVSAYLRSCIFEAESLRSQVREALMQMNAASSPTAANLPDNSIRTWPKRLFSRRSPAANPEIQKTPAHSQEKKLKANSYQLKALS